MAVNDLPSNVSYGTVIGRYLLAYADGVDADLNPDGVPAKGSILFTPAPANIKNISAQPAPVTMLPATIECPLDEYGYLLGKDGERGVRLVATDDPDNNPVDWTWQVTYRLTDETDTPVRGIPTHHIEIPSGGTVDLTIAAPVAESNGVWYTAAPPNTLTIGTVATSASGGNAQATITGDAPNQTLNLVIPRGEQGIQGPPGALENITATAPIAYDDGTNTLSFLGIALDDVTDVSASTPTTGDVLKWNGSAWANETYSINDLSDVVITGTPLVGAIITYNGTNWVNQEPEAPLPAIFMMMGA